MKKVISILLTFCLLLGSNTFIFAEDAAASGGDDQAAWEASLGEYTETPANAFTPAKQDLAAQPEYVDGEVLFSRSDSEGLLSSLKTDNKLSKAGVSDIQEIVSFEESETTWYKAKIEGSVEDAVSALNEIEGVVQAEPNYLHKTEAVGQPSAAEMDHAWYLNGNPGQGAEHGNTDNNGLHKGWYKN